MGIDASFGLAYIKSQLAAGQKLPLQGTVFISVNDRDKPHMVEPARIFSRLGLHLIATTGTAEFLAQHGISAQKVNKVYEGRPNAIDLIKNKSINLVINTSSGKLTIRDSSSLRQATILYNLPYTTTLAGAKAMAQAMHELQGRGMEVRSLQEYYGYA
jgi:carbamoyl-phosphate synthase large subunit